MNQLRSQVRSVGVIDDSPDAREAYKFPLEDIDLKPIMEEGPIPKDFETILKKKPWDALICDHHLRNNTYASLDGAELVVKAYKRGFPSILVTRYQDILNQIRPFREHIPVLIDPNSSYEPESLQEGFEICLEEFKGNFRESRRPWKTLIRIEDIEERSRKKLFHLVVTGWDTSRIITLDKRYFSTINRQMLKPGARLFAKVNIGAEKAEELYFKDWEIG